MARIETYGNDNKVTGFDKVIGTDVDKNKMTKNYLMKDIREYIFDGASPEVGGKLKITNVVQDTPIPGTETPEALLNNLDPILEVSKYEVLVVSLAFNDSNNEGVLTNNVYLFNKTDIVVGFQQYESTSADFILLSSSTDNSNLVESVGNGDIEVYKGFDATDNKHQIRNIKSDTLLITIDGDAIKIEAEEVDLGGVRSFFVNNKYTGEDELGTVAKPYKTLDGAISAFIGNGNTIEPQFFDSRIIVQASATQEQFTSDLSIIGLKIEVQDGANIRYIGSENYMIDTRKIINNSNFVDKTFRIEIYGDGIITSNKGIIYSKGSESLDFIRYNVIIYGSISFSSYYKISTDDLVTIPVTKGTTEPVIQTQNFDALFFNGDVMEFPVFVCDGDNSISSNISFGVGAKPSFRVGTQVFLNVKNKGYFDGFNAEDIRFGYSQNNIGHYGGLDESVQNGESNVLLPNENINFIRLDSGFVRINNFFATTAGTRTQVKNLFRVSDNTSGDTTNLIIQGGEFFSNVQVDALISLESSINTYIFNDLFVNGASPLNFTIEYTGSGTLTNAEINNCNISKISDNIDLTKGNSTNVSNRISSRIVESLRSYQDRSNAESDSNNTIGTKFINRNGGDLSSDTSTWFIDVTMQ
jgi:hypothetical protein